MSLTLRVNGKDFHLANVYIPPEGSCPRGYTPGDLSGLNANRTLVLGDFNAHDRTWYYNQAEDRRGSHLLEQFEEMVILNDPYSPTRRPRRVDERATAPDITFCSQDISPLVQWKVVPDLSSDHNPILIDIAILSPIPKKPTRTFLNYRKANWDGFTTQTEEALASFNPAGFESLDVAVRRFNEIILAASKGHIPAGFVRKYVPLYSREVKLLMQQRRHLLNRPPAQDITERINDLSDEIKGRLHDEAQARWAEVVEAINYRTTSSKFWRVIRSLHSRQVSAPDTHEAILPPNSRSIPSPKEQANLLASHYAAISRLPPDPADRLVQRRLRRLDADEDLEPQFAPAQVVVAVRNLGSSKATGPDGVAYAHLKNLGPHGIRSLVDIYNQSIRLNVIPSLWKRATMIPLLKPGKPPSVAGSYRPISLLCTPSKVLERLILDKVLPLFPVRSFQHGFKSLHSTSTLLTTVSQSVLEGLNHGKPALRSLVAAIDISKAFDTVPRYKLVSKILDTQLQPNYKRWLSNFIAGRQGRISYGGVMSKHRQLPNGVPQGAVLSPSLFSLFTHDLPEPTNPAVKIYTYADDLTIVSQHPRVDEAAIQLQDYLRRLEEWLTTNRMSAEGSKSSLTVVTPHNTEYRYKPTITLMGQTIPVNNDKNILGVTIDRGWTFRQHTQDINAKAKSRLNVMKALAATSFGHSKESLTALYKQFVRPVLTYASSVWQPDLAQSHMQVLQRTQNSALRIATGCTRSTPTAHLHAETKVLPLKDYLELRGTQIFSAAAAPDHPLHEGLYNPVGTRRHIHTTPSSHYTALRAMIPPLPLGRSESSWLHQSFVARALANAPPNTLLGEAPPPVNPDEADLHRQERVHLARLRCGHHLALRSYENRLRPEVDPACRWCGEGQETIYHIFQECPQLAAERADAGVSNPRDLWDAPAVALRFAGAIGLIPGLY